MIDIQQDIRNWLHQQSDWLQQGAEILLSSGEVSDEDIRKLSEMLKTLDGQKVTSHRAFDRLAPVSFSSAEIRLLEIGAISGIEKLTSHKPLSFGEGNLCVIYGNNGSGKSGYTRLLKKACGKPRAKDLKPNVFKPMPSVRKCTICYQVAGKDMPPAEWRTDEKPIDVLRAVDIFDDDAAVGYLTEETESAYTPPVVALFENLAKVCDRIIAQLQTEQNQLVCALRDVLPEYASTEAGIAYRALKHNGDKTTIKKFTQWREEDEVELAQLTERLKVDDPAALARRNRQAKRQVDQIADTLQKAAVAFGDKNISGIRALRAEAKKKRRIADEAAVQVDSTKGNSAKLDISTDTWRRLWEAARAYSQTAKREFPVAKDELCVLCHQKLDGDAQERLNKFEKFVLGKLETEAKTAEKAYRQALDNLPEPTTSNDTATQCQAAELTEEHWVGVLGEFWGHVNSARDALLAGESTMQAPIIAWPKNILDELAAHSASLESKAARHEQDAKRSDRDKASKRKLNLEARRWVARQSDAINGEVERLRKVDCYNEYKKWANSRPISNKARDIAEQVITEAFVNRFNDELKALGAFRISVELLKARAQKGRVLHKIQLRDTQTQESPISILSEGERRIVGLAAFLADVTVQPHATPFVFDDPISSLDSDFELRVAYRLAELAKKRQVIIFTHRLSFYGDMEVVAKKSEKAGHPLQLQQSCIEAFNDAAGHPVDQEAWNANTTKANNILLNKLSNAKKNEVAYKDILQSICREFRNLLERTVEFDLLNEVVKRHHRNITTNNTLWALTHINHDDCKLIDDLMSKYSVYAHSQSLEAPSPAPEESELREDIQSLKEWREKFKARRKKNNN